MSFYQFRATVSEDQVIRLPDGVTIPPGEYAMVLSAPIEPPPPSSEEADIDSLRDLLLSIATKSEALGIELPSDMAENHDHYAHGKPRR